MVITGVYYALGAAGLGLIATYLLGTPWAGVPFAGFAAFSLYFFRDPNRVIPEGNVAVSPADGKVMVVRPNGTDGSARISIFMSPIDVHVNRAPVAGKITGIEYKKGEFLVASREEASEQNEMNTVTLETQASPVVFKQIAGLVARRIIFYKRVGDTVAKGERVGLIQFGSRMDVILGPEWEMVVREGQRVSAGSSIIAQQKG